MAENGSYSAAVFGMKTVIRLLLYLLIAVFIIFCGRTAYTYGYALFNEQGMEEAPGTDVAVIIPEGSSVREIGAILEKNGLIENVNLFQLQERLSNYHGKMQAGTYTLNTSQTPTELMAIMSGESPTDDQDS